jgi:glycerol-1-phosphate dehydrogenase [NAD(P)+]
MPTTAFTTTCGSGLLAKLPSLCAPPTVIVTMEDLWQTVPELKQAFDAMRNASYTVFFVTSLEERDLEQSFADIAAAAKASAAGALRTVVGVGGGQAIDVAKYFAWRSGAALFQLPTALTVDAAWGHQAAVRRDGLVTYVGWAVPQTIFIDFGLVRSAPKALNLSGIGDVLCFHTAHADWALAAKHGKDAPWPYDERMVAEARAVMQRLKLHMSDVRDLTDVGISELVTALSFGGAAFHANGWNPRAVEGFDHIFFYALEHRSGLHFIHGYPVLLGVYIGAWLQDNDAQGKLRGSRCCSGVMLRGRYPAHCGRGGHGHPAGGDEGDAQGREGHGDAAGGVEPGQRVPPPPDTR